MNILVCGFMGAGKTSFVKRFQQNNLGYSIFDLDHLVANSLGIVETDLGEWIKKNSLEFFRQKEIDILKKVLHQKKEKQLIALGGGTVENAEYRELATKTATVFLNIAFETCYLRIKNSTHRPLASMEKQKLQELYEKRILLYRESDLSLLEEEIKEIDGLGTLVHNLSRILTDKSLRGC